MSITTKEVIEAKNKAENMIKETIAVELEAFYIKTGFRISYFETEVYSNSTICSKDDGVDYVDIKLGVEI